jgi:hypothetical protein
MGYVRSRHPPLVLVENVEGLDKKKNFMADKRVLLNLFETDRVAE